MCVYSNYSEVTCFQPEEFPLLAAVSNKFYEFLIMLQCFISPSFLKNGLPVYTVLSVYTVLG